MLIPSVTHQTGGLSINCIYVLLAFPILTFIIPHTRMILRLRINENNILFLSKAFQRNSKIRMITQEESIDLLQCGHFYFKHLFLM